MGEFAATNILLAAAALATNRMRLGPEVTPVPRRRPRELAREIATLDRLSGGRMVLGVGLGNPIENEYGRFGEPTDPKVLAGLLDEGLQAITQLWSGEPVTFHGQYLTVDDVIMRPTPVQRPRVPIWVGGTGRTRRQPDGRPLGWRRAHHRLLGPAARPRRHRRNTRLHPHPPPPSLAEREPFELIVGGSTPANPATARDILAPLADAGATWWDERFPIDKLGKFDAVRVRIEDGPPSLK